MTCIKRNIKTSEYVRYSRLKAPFLSEISPQAQKLAEVRSELPPFTPGKEQPAQQALRHRPHNTWRKGRENLTDTWQLLTCQPVHQAFATQACAQMYKATRVFDDLAHDCGVTTLGMLSHGR